MAISERLRLEMSLLSEESRKEIRRLAGEAEIAEEQADEPEWLRRVREAQAMFAREGVTIDAVAEVRAIRDEI